MQPKARNVYVFDRLRSVQGGELHPEAFGVTGLDAGDTACLKMPSQTFVPKRLDHSTNVSRCAPCNTKRVFDIDMAHCPNCGGELKIVAAILEQPVIEKILTHLGLQARAPPRAPARGSQLQAA